MLPPWVEANGLAPLVSCYFFGGAFCATTMEFGKRGNGEKEGLTELEGISANELVLQNVWWLKSSRDGNSDVPLWKNALRTAPNQL